MTKARRLSFLRIFDPAINDKIRAIAIRAYQTLGCCGMARVDVFLTYAGKRSGDQ